MIRCFLFWLALPALALGQTLDTARSRVTFTIRNLGVQVEGQFGAPQGTAGFDAAQPGNSRFDIRVRSATINTGIGMRDRHLRDEDYFDVRKYPDLRFASTRITCSGTSCMAEGNLTIKATTKLLRVPFSATREGSAWRLSGTFTVNRRDYGIGGWSPTLSDEATVTVVLVVADN